MLGFAAPPCTMSLGINSRSPSYLKDFNNGEAHASYNVNLNMNINEFMTVYMKRKCCIQNRVFTEVK